MSEKTALLSDIHGNSPALRAVLHDVARAQCNRVYVLGDIINGVDPNGCLDLFRSIDNVICLKGNAESYALTPDLDRFPNRHEPMYANLIRLIDWWRGRVTDANWKWMFQFPLVIQTDGTWLGHDSPFDRQHVDEHCPSDLEIKYRELVYHGKGITPNTSDDEFARLFAWMDEQKLARVFCAHTHVPFFRMNDSKTICNTGSVGMPLDGDPRASWVLLDQTNGASAITLRRVAYDIDALLGLIDQAADYPDHGEPEFQRAYKMTFQTGVHWNAFLK